MSLEYAHGAIQWAAADVATTTKTVSGLSFQPKALRFYIQGLGSAADANSQTAHLRRSVGFATSTSLRRCVGTQDQDAAGTQVCTTGYRDDCVAMTLTSTPAADGLLDLSSITSDGFVLTVDDASPVDVTVFWEAWGGADISVATVLDVAEPSATGGQDYTVTGFVANGDGHQVVMFAGCQSTAASPTATRNDSGLCVGFATGGADADNVVVMGNSDDASTSSDTDGYCKTGECLGMIVVAGGNPSARAKLTQFNADGFRLNWIARATTGRHYIALAMKGGGWKAGSYTITGNSANATATVSGLSFAPKGISSIGRMTAQQAAGTSSAQDRMSLGSGSSTSSRRSMGSLDQDAQSTAALINLTMQYDQILCYPDTAGGLAAACDINAMNADGFQIIVDTAGGVASEWQGFLAFGNDYSVGSSAGTSTGAATGHVIVPATGGAAGSSIAQATGIVPFAGRRRAILDHIISAQSETHGFNAERANIPDSAVVRTDDHTVTITLPALANYDVSAQETITATVPAEALVGAADLVATPTFTVAASGGTTDGAGSSTGSSTAQATSAKLWAGAGASSGTSIAQAVGAAITPGSGASTGVATAQARAPSYAVGSSTGSSTAQAIGAKIVPASGSSVGTSTAAAGGYQYGGLISGDGSSVGSSTAAATGRAIAQTVGAATGAATTQAAGAAIKGSAGAATGSSTAQATGQNAAAGGFDSVRQAIIDHIVSAQAETFGWNAERLNIPVTGVVRTSATVVTITLPALPGYDISALETITATVPAEALMGGEDVVASPTFQIIPTVASFLYRPNALLNNLMRF